MGFPLMGTKISLGSQCGKSQTIRNHEYFHGMNICMVVAKNWGIPISGIL